MLVHVHDWHVHAARVFIPCPVCRSLLTVALEALDCDGCVSVLCSEDGRNTVQLMGWMLLLPATKPTATGAA